MTSVVHQSTTRARWYFAAQAVAGALWWVAVYASDDVRRLTLGGWEPAIVVGPDLLLFVGGSAMAAISGRSPWAAATAAWTILVTTGLAVYGLLDRQAGWGALLMFPAAVGTAAAASTFCFGHLPLGWFFIGPFRFKPAPARTPGSNLRHSLGQLVFFWTTFLVALPLVIAWVEGRLRLDWAVLDASAWSWLGAAVFAAASCLGLWACISMALEGHGTPLPATTGRDLVVLGPYRYVRNPMAVAGAVQTVGAGLFLGSWLVVVAAAAGGMFWNLLIRPAEEADLAERFGPAYERYRERVSCWLPNLRSQHLE